MEIFSPIICSLMLIFPHWDFNNIHKTRLMFTLLLHLLLFTVILIEKHYIASDITPFQINTSPWKTGSKAVSIRTSPFPEFWFHSHRQEVLFLHWYYRISQYLPSLYHVINLYTLYSSINYSQICLMRRNQSISSASRLLRFIIDSETSAIFDTAYLYTTFPSW